MTQTRDFSIAQLYTNVKFAEFTFTNIVRYSSHYLTISKYMNL